MRNSFVMYTDYMQHLEIMSMEQRGIFLTAIMRYASGETLPEMDGMVCMAFSFARAQMDRDDEQYQKTKEARREAGRRGGVARVANSSTVKQTVANQANATFAKQTVANQADTVTDTVTDIKKKDTIVSKEKASRFSPPTTDEVKIYCQEHGYEVDADRFVDFYSSKDWFVGKNKMKDWKAAVRNWARSQRQELTTKGATETKSSNRFANFDQREHDYDSMVMGEIMRRCKDAGR